MQEECYNRCEVHQWMERIWTSDVKVGNAINPQEYDHHLSRTKTRAWYCEHCKVLYNNNCLIIILIIIIKQFDELTLIMTQIFATKKQKLPAH